MTGDFTGLTNDQFFWMILGMVAGVVVIVGVVSEYFTARLKTRGKIEQARAREETRRELAAYVAEGSMSPEDAERILRAEPAPTTPARTTHAQAAKA